MKEEEVNNKLKYLELEEMELKKNMDNLNLKLDRMVLEKQDFEKEVKFINDLAAELKIQSETINDFKKNFDSEKESINRRKMENEN